MFQEYADYGLCVTVVNNNRFLVTWSNENIIKVEIFLGQNMIYFYVSFNI